MWRVEIQKRDGAHSTLPDYDPSPTFFRLAETAEMLEDLRNIFGERIVVVTPVAPAEEDEK